MTHHKIPAQYASYCQPHPLKPYKPYVLQQAAVAPPLQTKAESLLGRFSKTVAAAAERGTAGGAGVTRGTPPSRSPNSSHTPVKRARQRGAVKSTAVPSSGSSRRKSSTNSDLLLSSTPHAPRQKRSVLDLIPHGDLNILPSTHDLLRTHTYIDSGRLQAVVREDGEGRRRGERGRPVSREGVDGGGRERGGEGEKGRREGGGTEKKKMIRRQAWHDDNQVREEEIKRVVKVRPFRRTVTTTPPEGIPLLNLTNLNEPDHEMEPIELMITEDDGLDTVRSAMSWGVPYIRSPDTTVDGDREGEKTDRQRGEAEKTEGEEREGEGLMVEEEEEEEEISESRQTHMDVTHAKFVEEKILSHERAISSLSPHPPHTLPPPPSSHRHTSTRPIPRVGMALQSHLTFGMGVAEMDLSRRLRFEARVLTQNGRDVHRELCGFFFLADGSITVYEFRQFGKKSSALPLVQRKVYCHQVGHRRGEPYQINLIRKGATLHFPTSLLPSLPDYMASRPLLSLRITQCSERDKRELLCVNRKPTECVSIDSYLQQPLSPAQQRAWSDLRVLQGTIRRQLTGRASKTLVGLGRLFSGHSTSSLPSPLTSPLVVERALLRSSLHTFHILINDHDFKHLWQLLTTMGEFGATGEGVKEGRGEGVRTDRCVAGLVGEMNEDRKAIVRKVFQKLDTIKSGRVTLTSVRRFYRHTSHDIEGVWFDHTHQTPLHTEMTTINYAEFENYYEGVSIETSKDAEFITKLKTAWTL